jgi:hypothetical protein
MFRLQERTIRIQAKRQALRIKPHLDVTTVSQRNTETNMYVWRFCVMLTA